MWIAGTRKSYNGTSRLYPKSNPYAVNDLSAAEVLSMATLGSSRAVNCDHLIGTLTPGKQADYLVVDTPNIVSDNLLVDALIRQTKPTNIRQTVVAGEILKQN